MDETQAVIDQCGWASRTLLIFIAVIGLVFAWHLYLSVGFTNRVDSSQFSVSYSGGDLSFSVNPVTNLISIRLATDPGDDDDLFAALELELGTYSREKFDLYAMLIPYRVRRSTEPASEEAIPGIRQEAYADPERQGSIPADAPSNLSLEDVRVTENQTSGRSLYAVFGTVVNNGPDTLRNVTVRVYFLNNAGQRIAAKDFSPVLVTESPYGDNTPLRPESRKDFGYSVDDVAPSDWARQIEAEIVDLAVLEE